MMKRQVIEIDLTWKDNYYELSVTEILNLLVAKRGAIKRISIISINKRKEAK